jgi:glutamate synthase (NADPH/NADH) small chain
MLGVWAGGDIVTGAATVIQAMGAGRRAAGAIKAYLGLRDTDVIYGEALPCAERHFGLHPAEHGYARVRLA